MASLTAPTNRGADVTKGVASLLGLVALVIVVPYLLIRYIGWPLPHGLPSIDEITTAMGDRYVPDRFLVGALAVVCWIIWAELVTSVVVEALAHAQGRAAAQVPMAASAQRAAARLVAGVALLAALFAARGHTPDTVRVLTPAPVVAVQEASAAPAELADVEATPEVALPTYTVAPRDTLWDISERCLGDPMRWGEIWNLNQHQTMVDGRSFSDPDRINPGWVLNLPADARLDSVVGASAGPVTPANLPASPDTPAAPDAPGGPRVEVLTAVGDADGGRVEVLTAVDGSHDAAAGTTTPAPQTRDASAPS